MKKSLIVLLSVISMGVQAQTNMNDTIFNLSEVTVKDPASGRVRLVATGFSGLQVCCPISPG